jgi:hypothetical protein
MSGARIYVELLRVGARGPIYRARLGSPVGDVLVKRSTEPLLAGARVLVSQGVTGILELWDSQRPYPRLYGDIALLAKLSVKEDEKTSPTFRVWRPFPVAPSWSKSAVRAKKLALRPSEPPPADGGNDL